MGGVFNESMSSLDKDDYRDSVLYRRFYHRMCKKRKHLEPKCTKIFPMLVYDTSVNHMHSFIQLKPVIYPYQTFSKKRILSEPIKNCDLMAPATVGVSGTGSFRRKSSFKLTSYTLNGQIRSKDFARNLFQPDVSI